MSGYFIKYIEIARYGEFNL